MGAGARLEEFADCLGRHVDGGGARQGVILAWRQCIGRVGSLLIGLTGDERDGECGFRGAFGGHDQHVRVGDGIAVLVCDLRIDDAAIARERDAQRGVADGAACT